MALSEDLIAVGLEEVTGQLLEPDQDIVRVPSLEDLDRYFRECGDEGFGQSGYDKQVSWCGIFATYLLIRVGARVKWRMGKGIQDLSGGEDILFVPGNQGIRRGDIAVRGSGSHHFIVLDDPPPAAGGIKCVEGNSGGTDYPEMRAGRRYQNHLAAVTCYYRVC
jgi:hypothetical protein